MQFQRVWITLVFIGGLAVPCPAQTEESQPNNPAPAIGEVRPIPKRIEQKRQQTKWMVPLLTAQYCAYQHAFQTAQRLAQAFGQDTQVREETRPYQESMHRVEGELAAFGKRPGDCQGKTIKALIPCLPSIEPLRRKGLGFEYVREWCRSEPYLTYEELEMGHESPYRNPPKPLDMTEVALTIQRALAQKSIQATVKGDVTAHSQRLLVYLKQGTDEDADTVLHDIVANHKDMLKRAQYREVVVNAEGSKAFPSLDLLNF